MSLVYLKHDSPKNSRGNVLWEAFPEFLGWKIELILLK